MLFVIDDDQDLIMIAPFRLAFLDKVDDEGDGDLSEV